MTMPSTPCDWLALSQYSLYIRKSSMKRFLLSAALLTSPLLALAVNVGVSINLGDPAFYGQIELGNAPPPPVMYGSPVIIQPGQVGIALQPLYLRVPLQHSRNWRRYCSMYNACGRPVYFVKDTWYRNVYAPQYRAQYPHGRMEERGAPVRVEEHRDRHDDHHEDRRDDRRDDHHDDHRDDRR